MKPCLFISLLLLSTDFLAAQQPSSPENRQVWRAEMPGGTYVVALSAITSVSSHEYLVDNTARVTEVNIGTLGSILARFYHIELNTLQAPGGVGQSAVNLVQEKMVEATDRAGLDIWKKVIKNYPTTTHAHTVEYRVDSKKALENLQKSVEKAWLFGNGTTFKP